MAATPGARVALVGLSVWGFKPLLLEPVWEPRFLASPRTREDRRASCDEPECGGGDAVPGRTVRRMLDELGEAQGAAFVRALAGRTQGPARGSLPFSRRWRRIRWMTRGVRMKAKMRIWPPQAGHSSGSTSKMRCRSSAHRRRASRREKSSGSAMGTSASSGEAPLASAASAALRRSPRLRLE